MYGEQNGESPWKKISTLQKEYGRRTTTEKMRTKRNLRGNACVHVNTESWWLSFVITERHSMIFIYKPHRSVTAVYGNSRSRVTPFTQIPKLQPDTFPYIHNDVSELLSLVCLDESHMDQQSATTCRIARNLSLQLCGNAQLGNNTF